MAKKNSKKRYRNEHKKNLQDYEQYTKKKEEKRLRKNAKSGDKSLKQKVDERKEQMQSTRRNRGKLNLNGSPAWLAN